MKIDSETLPKLLDSRDDFIRIYKEYVEYVLGCARLFPQLSKPRLIEARGAWRSDLTRVEENEPNLTDGLDHFKQAAHLAFWLRRTSPLIEAIDQTENPSDAPGYSLDQKETEFRALLWPYANEYLAFDFGYQIVQFYEKGVKSDRANAISIPNDYYKTACHFLKYKNVSPHALNLIYRSIFIA